MKIFRDYVMTWWQVGLLKAYVFIVGLIIGSYFADLFVQYIKLMLVVAIILAIYFLYRMFSDGFKPG